MAMRRDEFRRTFKLAERLGSGHPLGLSFNLPNLRHFFDGPPLEKVTSSGGSVVREATSEEPFSGSGSERRIAGFVHQRVKL